jgi:hypothetical protein
VQFQKYLEFKVTAPSEPGTFTYEFRFGSEPIGLFGETFSLKIIVLDDQPPKVNEYENIFL